MKKFKKLIPAFCMLLVSAVMLGTSTFAWFSMNTSVKATGLEVNAKSNATYLLINNQDKSGSEATGLDSVIDAKYVDTANTDKKVYPVTYFANVQDDTKIGNAVIKDKAGSSWTDWQTKHWFTANNGNSNAANDAVTNIKPVDIESEKDYRLEYNVWLTLSKDSEAVTDKKVKVTAELAREDTFVKAFVKIDSDELAVGNSGNATTAAVVSLSATTTVKVTIYVYMDGESANITSSYLNTNGSISGKLSLTFDLVD